MLDGSFFMTEQNTEALDRIDQLIHTVADFPKPGIQFKDITPLLACPKTFGETIELMESQVLSLGADLIAAPESRGFIFGVPLAQSLDIGFIPIRKPGKLPGETVSVEYELEYGTDKIEMRSNAIQPGQKVLLVDDVLATGGTISACQELVEKMGGVVIGTCFLLELSFLEGRNKIPDCEVFSLLEIND